MERRLHAEGHDAETHAHIKELGKADELQKHSRFLEGLGHAARATPTEKLCYEVQLLISEREWLQELNCTFSFACHDRCLFLVSVMKILWTWNV